MEERASVAVIIIFLCLFAFQCAPEKKRDLYEDGNYHLVLYTSPSSDCLDCINKAIKALDQVNPPDESIEIVVKKSEDLQDYKEYLANNYSNRSFSFSIRKLSLPHPSVALIKNNRIHMYFFVTNEEFALQESLGLSVKFLSALKNQDAPRNSQ